MTQRTRLLVVVVAAIGGAAAAACVLYARWVQSLDGIECDLATVVPVGMATALLTLLVVASMAEQARRDRG